MDYEISSTFEKDKQYEGIKSQQHPLKQLPAIFCAKVLQFRNVFFGQIRLKFFKTENENSTSYFLNYKHCFKYTT